jgi:hypothetical protein
MRNMKDYKKSLRKLKAVNRPVFILCFFVFACMPRPVLPAVLSSSSILVNVDDTTGRLFLSTIEGKKDVSGDENSNLLFYDEPPTSYTVIYVNDEVFIFGSAEGTFSELPVSLDASIEAVWENDLVRVKQTVALLKREGSGSEEGALITYSVENKSNSNRSIGLRILFDTYLGEKGRYHFQLSDGEKIEFEKTLKGKSLPARWMSLSKKNPPLCLTGIIEGIGTTPDKINFANYKTLQQHVEYNWVVPDVKRKRRFDNLPFSKNDSAIALYYKPVPVAPGGTRRVRSALGLCGPGDFVLSVPVTVVTVFKKGKEEKTSGVQQTPEPVSGLSQDDLRRIREELKKIAQLRGSLDEINSAIKKINAILESGVTQAQEDELIAIKKMLENMKEVPDRGTQ